MNRRRRNDRLNIGPIQPQHERQWRELWNCYLDFYQVQIPGQITDHTWRSILNSENLLGMAASRGEDLIGFATVILHEATWSMGRIAYLEDLFVRSDERRRGIAGMIIDELIRHGREKGWAKIYWHTEASNSVARRLYDGYCKADDFVRYRLTI